MVYFISVSLRASVSLTQFLIQQELKILVEMELQYLLKKGKMKIFTHPNWTYISDIL